MILLWFMLAVGVVGALATYDAFEAEMAAVTSEPRFVPSMWAIFSVVFIVDAILIICISRRQNWARIALLLLTVAGFAAMLWPEVYAAPLPWDWWISNVASAVLSVLALYWLFTGPGAAWFSRRHERAS